MDDERLKILIGSNIAALRKQSGLTQMGVAEKLNYSDKAVSKWERGESIPDVLTLVQLARLFNVTVNDILKDPNDLPVKATPICGKTEKMEKKRWKRTVNKNVILMLTSVLVWFVALLVFVVVSSIGISYSWLAFFAAIPANAIVLLCLRSAWHDFRWNCALISVIVWGCLLSIYMTVFTLAKFNFWKVLLLGIPGQIAILLWFHLFQPAREKEKTHE